MPWNARAKFMDWTEAKAPEELPVEDVIRMYDAGYIGADEATDKEMADFVAAMSDPNAEDACHKYGLADTGAGKLVIPYVFVVEMFPGCWPGRQGQARGDCVSWSQRNAALLTMVCDILSGQPDEKSGKVEGKPDVPPEGIADGVLSSEAYYWWRGHGGDGWHCPAAASVAVQKSGLVLRKNYPEYGVDLTNYSGRNAGLYGSRPPSGEIAKIGSSRLIHQATNASTFEAVRDLLANGYGVSTCGGEGLAKTRDEYGVSRRSGSWAHAMAYIGADDRDVIKQKYGEPLVLVLNSWARWNGGPRDIYQSAGLVPADKKQLWISLDLVNPATGNLMVPHGSCWVRYSEMKRRSMIAMSGANGWPRKNLPDMGSYVWG